MARQWMIEDLPGRLTLTTFLAKKSARPSRSEAGGLLPRSKVEPPRSLGNQLGVKEHCSRQEMVLGGLTAGPDRSNGARVELRGRGGS